MKRSAAARSMCAGVIAGAVWAAVSVFAAAESQSSPAASRTTFARDVAPILHEECATCHRPGGSAPFSLLTYAEVAPRARQIAAAVASRRMPPWKPEPAYGTFVGERRLTDEQIALIGRWAAEGAARGDDSALRMPSYSSDQWVLGEPDLIVRMPEPYNVAAAGADVFRNFVIPIGNDPMIAP